MRLPISDYIAHFPSKGDVGAHTPATGQPTRPTQPFILSGSINE